MVSAKSSRDAHCPECGRAAGKVKRVTLEHLLRDDYCSEITDEAYFVCSQSDCDTVYFTVGGQRFTRDALSVPFGLKGDRPRRVCYCFDHTVEEIEDEIKRTGQCSVVESIKTDMKGPGCQCEITNPLGRCCLKTVQTAVTQAFDTLGVQPPAAGSSDQVQADCCAGGAKSAEPSAAVAERVRTSASPRSRAGALAVGGSLVAAVLSSACCWLPLVLIGFGASAVGAAGFLAAFRAYFVAGAVVLLGAGFYLVYFRAPRCETGSACAAPSRGIRNLNRGMLWIATFFVAAFLLFPDYVGSLIASPASPEMSVPAERVASAEYRIEGMTCEGCSKLVRGALLKLPGVVDAQVDFDGGKAVVRYDAEAPLKKELVVAAVKNAGYGAAFVRMTKSPALMTATTAGETVGP